MNETRLLWFQHTGRNAGVWQAFFANGCELTWDESSTWSPGLVTLNGIMIGTATSRVGAEVLLSHWCGRIADMVRHDPQFGAWAGPEAREEWEREPT